MVDNIRKATVTFSFVQRRHQLSDPSTAAESQASIQSSTLFCELAKLMSWCEEQQLLPNGSVDFSVQEIHHPIKTDYIVRVGTESRELSSSEYDKDTMKFLLILMESNLKDKVSVRLSDDGNKLLGFTI